MRVCDPGKGSVRDGVALRDLNVRWLRLRIGEAVHAYLTHPLHACLTRTH